MASSKGSTLESTATKELKRKSTDIGWEYGVLADPNKLDSIKCLLCEKVMSGGVHRLKHHIAQITGNVALCPKATKDDQIKCRNAINEVKGKKKGKQEDDDALRADVNIGSNEPIDVDEMEVTKMF
jgi:hypothetical protein